MKNYIYGIHPVIEFLESGKEPETVFIQQGLQGPQVGKLRSVLRERGLVYKVVPVEKLNRITGKNHQGVICYMSPVTFHAVEGVIPAIFEEGKVPLVLVLDRITDVGNFGAICRSAACAGTDLVIIPARGAAAVTAEAVKASAGAISKIRIARVSKLKETLRFLADSGLRLYACTEQGKDLLQDADLSAPAAIIMGSEEDGISPAYLEMADAALRIPMPGTITSLNVSVAAGIVLYEACRQRQV